MKICLKMDRPSIFQIRNLKINYKKETEHINKQNKKHQKIIASKIKLKFIETKRKKQSQNKILAYKQAKISFKYSYEK